MQTQNLHVDLLDGDKSVAANVTEPIVSAQNAFYDLFLFYDTRKAFRVKRSRSKFELKLQMAL